MIFRITRHLEIDAGHRIMTHGSKCRHVHGHRYRIEAECQAQELQADGEQTDMVLDFGFLKDEMTIHIDHPCDHGFIAALNDHDVLSMFAPAAIKLDAWLDELAQQVKEQGFAATTHTHMGTKLYVIPVQPTAECLAQHWFYRLQNPVHQRSQGLASLVRVRVWETPNCMAEFTPAKGS